MNEWNIDQLDLDAYLARIKHPAVPPTLDALDSLLGAHVRTIPFENLSVLLGHAGIGLDAIAAKMVDSARGGYCFEHGLLFAAAAERLGFTLRRRLARIQPQRSGALTHLVLVVTVEGADYLVDVGFGSGNLHPIPLRDGAEINQGGWPHRITKDGPMWTVEKLEGGEWVPQHGFEDTETRPVDYEIGHHYVSTHPHSPFTGQIVVMRQGDGVLRKLVGGELTVEHAGGATTTTPVPPERLGDTLRELEVEVTPEQLIRLLEVARSRPYGDDHDSL